MMNHTMTPRHASPIAALTQISASRRIRLHQAATLVSRFDGSTSAMISSPSTTKRGTNRTRIKANLLASVSLGEFDHQAPQLLADGCEIGKDLLRFDNGPL